MDGFTSNNMETQNEGFIQFLVELASLLTFAIVRKLAVLLNFPPADIDDIERDPHPSYVFVSSLRQKGVIREDSISPLIDSLKKIGLHGVADDVTKSFKRNLLDSLPEGGTTREREHSVVKKTCTQHEHDLQKYFCSTCDSKICAECAFNFHKDKICDVIRLENLPQEIQARGDQLRTELRIVRELSVKSRNLLTEKKNVLLKVNENVRKEINKDKKAMIERTEKNALHLLNELDEKEKVDEKQLASESNNIEQACTFVENLEKVQSSIDSLSEFRKIIGSRKTATKLKQELEHQQIKLKQNFDLVYKKLSNNGKFGVLSRSVLIGGVMIDSKQLVHVFDERQNSNNVLLVCSEPVGSFKEYWRHQVTLNDQTSPVVMSCVERYNHGVCHVVFAVGNTVFNVRPHLTTSFYDFVESVSYLTIDSVEEGSWINNIAVYNPSNASGDVILISISGSSLLREYQVTGEILRTVETRDWVSSVTLVAYVNNHFAFSGRGRQDIVLVTDDGAIRQSGSIRPPSSPLSLSLVSLIWAGATWLSLWVSDGVQKQWKVFGYRQTGEIHKVCAEGTSCGDTDFPDSVGNLPTSENHVSAPKPTPKRRKT